jgi:hypothetical protein
VDLDDVFRAIWKRLWQPHVRTVFHKPANDTSKANARPDLGKIAVVPTLHLRGDLELKFGRSSVAAQ